MDEQPVVELKGISKHFGKGAARVDALRDVSFDVYPGTVIGLRGPSGSGKSTVLNVIGCIVEPSSGTMRLNGETVYDNKWLRSDLRSLLLEKIGFIFQSHNLLPFLNAWEILQRRILPARVPFRRRRARSNCWPISASSAVRTRCRAALRGRGAADRDLSRARQRSAHYPGRRADRRAYFAARRGGDGPAAQGRDRAPHRRDRGHA